jgi:hypothetical protein
MKKGFSYLALLIFLFTSSVQAVTPNIWAGLATNKTVYRAKEPIAISLTILNQNQIPYKALFASGKRFDFFLYKDNKVIWKWSGDKMYTQSLISITLEPNQPLTYVIIFEPKLLRIKPGYYRLIGAWITTEKEWTSQPLDILIK